MSRPAGAGLGSRALARLTAFFAGGPAEMAWSFLDVLLGWQERAAERHALRQLDDRMLKDIGLSRANIDAEAAKPFWRA
jgi:uncharacterized protein YjiS (DUF1127 family)